MSLIGRVFFKVPIKDFHCGLRGFRTRAIRELGLRTTGMEFASEMVVRSGLSRLRIAEVPTTLRPGGRTRAPHLKTWSDGWRHFKFLLMYSPKWLFFAPGLALAAFGLLLGVILMFGPVHIGPSIVLDLKSFLAACLLGIVGIQLVTFGALARFYATITGMLPPGYRSNRLVAFCTTDRLVTLAVVLFVLGAGLFGFSIYRWAEVDFGRLEDPMIPRLVAAGLSIMIVAVQIGFSAFLFGILAIPILERSPAQEQAADLFTPNSPMAGSFMRRSLAARETLSILSLLVAGTAATAFALLGVLRIVGLVPASAAGEIARVHVFGDWLFSADPDLLMLMGLAALGVLVGVTYGGRQNAPAGLFWGCAVWFAATTNAYFLRRR